MANLQQKITEKFLADLAKGDVVHAEKIEQLRKLMLDGKKPKAEDFAKLFALPPGDDVK